MYQTNRFNPIVSRRVHEGEDFSSKTVLVVEEDDLNTIVFREALLAHGYACIEAIDGTEAIRLTGERHPDLILMDIQLPGVSGMEVTRTLKAAEDLRHIPVIAVTAFDAYGDEKRVRACGFEDYLSKPVSIGHLIETVERPHQLTDCARIARGLGAICRRPRSLRGTSRAVPAVPTPRGGR